jgi:hypothetical protein
MRLLGITGEDWLLASLLAEVLDKGLAMSTGACAEQRLGLHAQGLLMTSYLKWRGLSETLLSLYRGGGALAGIASTLVFPALQRRLGAGLCMFCFC